MEWLDKLQIPGLILAAIVIFYQNKTIVTLVEKLGEIGGTLGKLSAILDLVCQKVVGGNGGRGRD